MIINLRIMLFSNDDDDDPIFRIEMYKANVSVG